MATKTMSKNDLADKQRDWRTLPKDILLEINQRLDDKTENKFELRRIRSVCSSWRSSLSHLTSTTLQFPLKVPLPNFLNPTYESNEPFISASLLQSDVFLFPSPLGLQESGWIVKVEQRPESNKWRLENSFLVERTISFEHPVLFRGSFDIFDCNVKEITRSYVVEYSRSNDTMPIKAKAVISWNNNSNDHQIDNFTVLVLFQYGKLGLWSPGEADWSKLPAPLSENLPQSSVFDKSDFSDIILFKGKFYATTIEGGLIMIDPITHEVSDLITIELDTDYGNPISYIVESNGCLYLIHKDVYNPSYGPSPPTTVKVFMLDVSTDKLGNQTNCCWNVVNNLEDRVFFASDYSTFSMPVKDLGWSNGNYVLLPSDLWYCELAQKFFYPTGDNFIDQWYCQITQVFEMDVWPWARYFSDCLSVYNVEKSKIDFGRENVGEFAKIFWPPPVWLLQLRFKYYPEWSSTISASSAASKVILVKVNP